jgi:histidinol-phosphate aminotransferase
MKIEDVLSLVRPHLLNLQPYSSARDEFDQSVVKKERFIYLDANENPFDTGYNRYPDPYQRELKNRISSIRGIPIDQIFLGNGSDEAIDLIIRLFCSEGDNILIPSPTYGMYKVSAEINNIKVKTEQLTADFQLGDSFRPDERTKVVFLCSPNNPSGNLLKVHPELYKCIVVVDEAYIDFTTNPSFLNQLYKFPNLIVLQTLSKAWGLAGLRLGMAFAHPAIVSLLNKIKPPYNISSATQRLALDALQDTSKGQWVQSIIRERTRVASELIKITSVKKVYPSEANFLLVRIDNARNVYTKLVNNKIVVRDRSNVKLCEDCLRITIGTAEENETLLKALR